jgi:hypothetical protein
MPKLIIPDVHERLDRLEAALRFAVDEIIFLGDFFDTFKPFDASRIVRVCRFINENIDGYVREDGSKITATFLLGNHELHYFFNNAAYTCSGYRPQTKAIVQELIEPDTIRKFRIFTTAGPYLVSHAGFHTHTLQYINPPKQQDDFIEWALQGKYAKIFGVGRSRGGEMDLGGPLWLDFNWEFEDIPGHPQIVGHTNGNDVRQKGASWCIDTGLKHVGIVSDDGTFHVEEL